MCWWMDQDQVRFNVYFTNADCKTLHTEFHTHHHRDHKLHIHLHLQAPEPEEQTQYQPMLSIVLQHVNTYCDKDVNICLLLQKREISLRSFCGGERTHCYWGGTGVLCTAVVNTMAYLWDLGKKCQSYLGLGIGGKECDCAVVGIGDGLQRYDVSYCPRSMWKCHEAMSLWLH